MTTSNDGSGIAQVPGASAAEPSAAEKKPRARKTPATAKKSTATPRAKSAKSAEKAAPAAGKDAAPMGEAPAESAPASKRTTRKPAASKTVKASKATATDTPAESATAETKAAPKTRKVAAKKAAPAAEAPATPAHASDTASGEAVADSAEAPAKKPKPSGKPMARKPRAPKTKAADEQAPLFESASAARDAAESASTQRPRTQEKKSSAPKVSEKVEQVAAEKPADVRASQDDSGTAAQPEKAAQPGETGESRQGSRRRRGSRGRGKGGERGEKQGNLQGAEAGVEGDKPSAEAAPIPLEGQNAPALPAGETQLALEAHEAPLAIDTGEQPKRNGRRRKRGKSNGNGNAATVADESQAPAKEEAAAVAKPAKAAKAKSKRKMFVSVLAGEQVEVVISEDGQLREYYVEMLHHAKIKGNIYKGVIHNVDPNLQAAFVSYGAVKNGFLQIDEVHPEYYLTPHETGKGHKYPLIQKVLKAGQEILVQVVKEPSGTKGAFLTSYLSLPGRFLVLTPGREQIGVSRKVGNDSERSRLRELLNGLNPGPGLGVIVRTVSEGASKTNLQKDLQSLKRIWRDVRKKGSSEPAPSLIYQELGLAARAVRDYLTEDVTELWVNDEEMSKEISEVISMLFPKRKDILHLHDDSNQSLFERFGLARQISQVQSREVVLPSGGRLVFDQTEALMAIDINSGRTGGKSNFEDMAFKINLEAAQHIPLQLRLRDIGGQVVVDFIEMRDRGHWREVEKTFRNGMREDRARHDVGKISSFGLLEVVRQRLGSSAISIASEPCPFCKGTGIRRNMEWQALQAMQDIQQLIRQNNEVGKTLVYNAGAELVLYLLNSKKEWLLDMEQENNVKLELHPGL